MHLTLQSRQLVSTYCNEKIFHHLLVEFNCDDKGLEDNIRETAQFYQNIDKQMNWSYVCREKVKQFAQKYEPCAMTVEGPLIKVHNSENPLVHTVTARGVQGALQTSILGVLSSPVIKHQLFYFSRHGESDYNVLGRIGGDADLSSRGRCYSEGLTKYLASGLNVIKPKTVIFAFTFFGSRPCYFYPENISHFNINFFFQIRSGRQSSAEQFTQFSTYLVLAQL